MSVTEFMTDGTTVLGGSFQDQLHPFIGGLIDLSDEGLTDSADIFAIDNVEFEVGERHVAHLTFFK
jgi:hypothetical protein